MLLNSWIGVVSAFAAGIIVALAGVAIVRRRSRKQKPGQLFRPVQIDSRASGAAAKMPQPVQGLPDLQVLGLLCATVAHDFNNLLSVIVTNAASLKHQTKGQASEEADEIQQAASRATDLCRQLLKLGSEKTEETQAVDLNALIEAELPLLRRFVSRRVLVLWEPGPDVHVFVARTEFRQLLLNLCANARDAMANGGILRLSTRLTVRASDFGAATESCAAVVVSDEGSGMDELTRERLFEPFFTTKRNSGGTGLGMSVVAAAASRHNATIEVQSAPAKGTTITVLFPRCEEPRGDTRASFVAASTHANNDDDDGPRSVAC